jgi:hypothetical protein
MMPTGTAELQTWTEIIRFEPVSQGVLRHYSVGDINSEKEGFAGDISTLPK